MNGRRIFTVALILLMGCVMAVDIFAATLVVTKTTDTTDGVCDVDCSLREAIAAAVSGDVVVFSPFFNSPQTITLTVGQIPITRNITIAGPGQGALIVSGNDTSRIFSITDGPIVDLSGMKLRDGRVTTEC